MIHLCASLLSPSIHPSIHPSLPRPSPPEMACAHARTAHAVAHSILPCHEATRFELSLSGSVGPFASLMIALHAVYPPHVAGLNVLWLASFAFFTLLQGSLPQFRKSLMSPCGRNLSKAE